MLAISRETRDTEAGAARGLGTWVPQGRPRTFQKPMDPGPHGRGPSRDRGLVSSPTQTSRPDAQFQGASTRDGSPGRTRWGQRWAPRPRRGHSQLRLWGALAASRPSLGGPQGPSVPSKPWTRPSGRDPEAQNVTTELSTGTRTPCQAGPAPPNTEGQRLREAPRATSRWWPMCEDRGTEVARRVPVPSSRVQRWRHLRPSICFFRSECWTGPACASGPAPRAGPACWVPRQWRPCPLLCGGLGGLGDVADALCAFKQSMLLSPRRRVGTLEATSLGTRPWSAPGCCSACTGPGAWPLRVKGRKPCISQDTEGHFPAGWPALEPALG